MAQPVCPLCGADEVPGFPCSCTIKLELREGPRAPSRFDYVKYDPISVNIQDGFKAAAIEFESLVNQLNSSRAKSLALTKLEEVYMWVGKAIRDDQIARTGSVPLQEERKDG